MFNILLRGSKTFVPRLQQAAGARTHRKPRWLPVAKSKIFRVPKRPEVPEEEKKELARLNYNYHTQMRGIRRYYHEEMLLEKTSMMNESSEESIKQEALEFVNCVKINEEWNKKIALEREMRQAKEREDREKHILEYIEKKERKNAERIALGNQLVRKEKDAAKTFITQETLDAAIAEALANPVDFNFAIDLQGNKYYGRDANTVFEKKVESKS